MSTIPWYRCALMKDNALFSHAACPFPQSGDDRSLDSLCIREKLRVGLEDVIAPREYLHLERLVGVVEGRGMSTTDSGGESVDLGGSGGVTRSCVASEEPRKSP